jgi:hypothetical protein
MLTPDHEALEGFTRRNSGLLVPDGGQLLGAGRYTGKIIRCGDVIDEFECSNLVVNQGLDYLLGAALAAQTVVTSWYIGLFSGNYTVIAADTASTIAANATEVSGYGAGARQAWTAAEPSGQSVTNSASQASFTFNAALNIYGAFLISSATISGTGGTLFSGAQFGASKSVVSGDQLLLTYTYTAASA